MKLVILTVFALVAKVASQGILEINENGVAQGDGAVKESTTHRPYRPLRPLALPPYFQNMGMSLPPPPPPPLVMQHPTRSPSHSVDLGFDNEEKRFFFGFLQQLKPLIFPWLRTTTAAPATGNNEPSNAESGNQPSNPEAGNEPTDGEGGGGADGEGDAAGEGDVQEE